MMMTKMMMKLLCQIALLAATTTTTMFVSPVSATTPPAEEQCCQCDHTNNLYDIIRMTDQKQEQQDNNNNNNNNNNKAGGKSKNSKNNNNDNGDKEDKDSEKKNKEDNRRGFRGRRVRGLQTSSQKKMGDGMRNVLLGDQHRMLPGENECCPCPSKLLVVTGEEDDCLSSSRGATTKGEEEFCLGTLISVIGGVSDLLFINTKNNNNNNCMDGGDVDAERSSHFLLITREILEELSLLSQVVILAEICREGENLPVKQGGDHQILVAVRLAAEQMKLPSSNNFPKQQWNPYDIVVRNSTPPNIATVRIRLLELAQFLEERILANMMEGGRGNRVVVVGGSSSAVLVDGGLPPAAAEREDKGLPVAEQNYATEQKISVKSRTVVP